MTQNVTNIKKPELLSPAGDWPSLRTAVESGADSVYFGIKGINMRHLANNFDILELPKIMGFLHEKGKRGYLTLNTVIMNEDLDLMQKILIAAKDANVDAVILWDMAVLAMARDLGLEIHLSTQASVANIESVAFYEKLGVKRVVLARECTLADIGKIVKEKNKKGLESEIETFIHGAMCVSISGRCFMSMQSNGQSANKGKCYQPCRREYYIKDTEGEADFIMGPDYVLSPKDLCTIDFIDELIGMGVDSFKIEGRMRSPEYIQVVTECYRKAIDAYSKGELTEELKKELKNHLAIVYNRGFSTGFYFGQPQDWQSKNLEHLYEKVYIGEVCRFFKKINVAEIRLRAGDLKKNDVIVIIGKNTLLSPFPVQEMQKEGTFVDSAQKGELVGVKMPSELKPKDKIFLWKKKF